MCVFWDREKRIERKESEERREEHDGEYSNSNGFNIKKFLIMSTLIVEV